MKHPLVLVTALALAAPSSPRACEAPGPCPFVDVCDGPDCDASGGAAPAATPARPGAAPAATPARPGAAPAATPARPGAAPECGSAGKAPCEPSGGDDPDATRAPPDDARR